MGSTVKTLWRSALLAAALAAAAAAVAAPALGAPPRPLPALSPAPRDALTNALETGRLSEAEYALERARSLFRLGKVRREFGAVERAGPRDATLILRDLAVRQRFLSGRERAQAERLLARPDSGGVPVGDGWSAPPANQQTECDANVCVHWVDDSGDPDFAAPAFKNTVKAQLATIWTKEIVDIGYRPPLDDSTSSNHGPDGKLDIYLENLGGFGVFGYCTSDDPNVNNLTVFTVSAYCVLDNNYSAAEFGTSQSPTEFLQVTAAHEFNHASQFAYDWLEDLWLMEGTATNMEETVYPNVNDNVTFLRDSQLTRPRVPLDRGGLGDTEYGAWIWWRYLEEKAYGGDPTVIRRIWNRADASVFGRDEWSLLATKRVLAWNGKVLADEYSKFAVANRRRDYLDGRKYPSAPPAATYWLGRRNRTTPLRTTRVNHLATHVVSLRPARSAPRSGRLRIRAEVNPSGGRARVILVYRNGRKWIRTIKLNSRSVGVRTVPFGRLTVKRVDLVLTNGSSRTRCWSDLFDPPFYSCYGVPRDDRAPFRFRARIR